MKIFIILLALSTCLSAEILRLSKVVGKPAPGITRHEFGDGEEKQTVFIEDKAFITEADIKTAVPSPTREDSIDITLTDVGTDKMIAATAPMRPGIDRIAIIIDGKTKSVPVVQSVPLGKRFVINGLDKKDEPLRFAGLLSGKTEEEIDEYIVAEKARIAALPKPPPPDYYTDEEYEQLAAERDKIGLNYMDRLYTEKELDELLSPGMTLAEVTGIFGKANHVSHEDDGTWEMTFETAPERLPKKPKMRMVSFITKFSDGKLASWGSYMHSEAGRRPKQQKSEPKLSNLISNSPQTDMSAEDFDFIKFIEDHEFSLKEGATEPTISDISGLLGALYSLGSSHEDDKKGIDSQCDVISIVAMKIPELAALVKKHQKDRIPLSDLGAALKPYAFGDKKIP